jgi:hypothetical protein
MWAGDDDVFLQGAQKLRLRVALPPQSEHYITDPPQDPIFKSLIASGTAVAIWSHFLITSSI